MFRRGGGQASWRILAAGSACLYLTAAAGDACFSPFGGSTFSRYLVFIKGSRRFSSSRVEGVAVVVVGGVFPANKAAPNTRGGRYN